MPSLNEDLQRYLDQKVEERLKQYSVLPTDTIESLKKLVSKDEFDTACEHFSKRLDLLDSKISKIPNKANSSKSDTSNSSSPSSTLSDKEKNEISPSNEVLKTGIAGFGKSIKNLTNTITSKFSKFTSDLKGIFKKDEWTIKEIALFMSIVGIIRKIDSYLPKITETYNEVSGLVKPIITKMTEEFYEVKGWFSKLFTDIKDYIRNSPILKKIINVLPGVDIDSFESGSVGDSLVSKEGSTSFDKHMDNAKMNRSYELRNAGVSDVQSYEKNSWAKSNNKTFKEYVERNDEGVGQKNFAYKKTFESVSSAWSSLDDNSKKLLWDLLDLSEIQDGREFDGNLTVTAPVVSRFLAAYGTDDDMDQANGILSWFSAYHNSDLASVANIDKYRGALNKSIEDSSIDAEITEVAAEAIATSPSTVVSSPDVNSRVSVPEPDTPSSSTIDSQSVSFQDQDTSPMERVLEEVTEQESQASQSVTTNNTQNVYNNNVQINIPGGETFNRE